MENLFLGGFSIDPVRFDRLQFTWPATTRESPARRLFAAFSAWAPGRSRRARPLRARPAHAAPSPTVRRLPRARCSEAPGRRPRRPPVGSAIFRNRRSRSAARARHRSRSDLTPCERGGSSPSCEPARRAPAGESPARRRRRGGRRAGQRATPREGHQGRRWGSAVRTAPQFEAQNVGRVNPQIQPPPSPAVGGLRPVDRLPPPRAP